MNPVITNPKTGWFLAGLVLVAVFGTYAPRFTGGVVVLIALVLALELSKLNLI